MDSDLATALAAERAIVRRAVAGARDIDGGWVVRHPPLPDVWQLNRVHLTGRAGGRDGAGTQALADRELAGLPHRRVTLDDSDAADAVWPWLQERGWRRERSVVMVRDAAMPEATAGAETVVLGAATLLGFQQLAFAEDAPMTPASAELPARIAAAQATLRAGTEWRAFGAGDARRTGDTGPAGAGLPASTATLYLDPDVGGRRVAFVDAVATLRAHRERGLARAVMVAALAAAGESGAELVALFADADDWPQVFYASCGFETIGRQTVFHRSW